MSPWKNLNQSIKTKFDIHFQPLKNSYIGSVKLPSQIGVVIFGQWNIHITAIGTPTSVEEAVGALPGLLVAQAAHLSSVALLLTIQVGHSHDPSAGLNLVDND